MKKLQHDHHSCPKLLAKCAAFMNQNQNQNSLLVKGQTGNTTPGGLGLTGGDQSRTLTREVNLDTQSSDILAEEIRESGSSFQSLIV